MQTSRLVLLPFCFAVIDGIHPGPKPQAPRYSSDGHWAMQDMVATPGAAAQAQAFLTEARPVRMVLQQCWFYRHRHLCSCAPRSHPALFCHTRHPPGQYWWFRLNIVYHCCFIIGYFFGRCMNSYSSNLCAKCSIVRFSCKILVEGEEVVHFVF